MKKINHYLLLNLTNSFHFIITQSLLSLTLSFMLNNSIIVYSLFTGFYMTCLGLSSLVLDSKKIIFNIHKIHKILIINTITSWFLLLLIPLYLSFHTELNNPFLNHLFLMIGALNSAILGFCSGVELPLYTHLNQQTFTVKVLVSDYFGSALGMFLFNFVLYPFLGINGSIFFSLTISIIGFVIFCYSIKIKANNDDHQERHHLN